MEIPPDTTAALVKGGLDAARAAAETPTGRAVSGNLGDGAVVVSRWIRNLLLPLALHNAKREAYFKDKFEAELGSKAQEIPQQHVQEPKASIVGPAIEGLGNAYEEDELRDRYLNLLASSMDARRSGVMHPAFGEILKQVTAEEVGLLNATLKPDTLSIARIRRLEAGTQMGVTVHNHLLDAKSDVGAPWVHADVPSWVDNWIRLGLVSVDWGRYTAADDAYDWVEGRPEYLEQLRRTDASTHDLSFDKGLLTVTDLGRRFALSVSPVERDGDEGTGVGG